MSSNPPLTLDEAAERDWSDGEPPIVWVVKDDGQRAWLVVLKDVMFADGSTYAAVYTRTGIYLSYAVGEAEACNLERRIAMQFQTADAHLESLFPEGGQLDAEFLNAFWDHLKAECEPEIGNDGLEYFSLADLRYAENAAQK